MVSVRVGTTHRSRNGLTVQEVVDCATIIVLTKTQGITLLQILPPFLAAQYGKRTVSVQVRTFQGNRYNPTAPGVVGIVMATTIVLIMMRGSLPSSLKQPGPLFQLSNMETERFLHEHLLLERPDTVILCQDV